jgi:hypothetical protein
MTEVVNAIVGFYLIVLGASAAAGVRQTLRGDSGAPSAAPPVSPGAAGAAPTGHIFSSGRSGAGSSGPGRSGLTHAAHRFGWATGVGMALGWLTGVEVYRAGRRGTIAAARKIKARRAGAAGATAPGTPAAPAATGPGVPAPGLAAPPAAAPAAAAPGAQPRPAPANPPTYPAPTTGPTSAPPAGPAGAAAGPAVPANGASAAIPAATPGPVDAHPGPHQAAIPGRPHLTLVPQPQEYTDAMATADISDYESLVRFTGDTASVASMEAEDAASASDSMTTGAEFALETATRVGEETQALEYAVAAMRTLAVDDSSTAAYHALLEAGQIYREQTAHFAAILHDGAATADTMAQAAIHYQETAQAALDVLNAHQAGFNEVAQDVGHGGADGHFYGVESTGAAALPAGAS